MNIEQIKRLCCTNQINNAQSLPACQISVFDILLKTNGEIHTQL